MTATNINDERVARILEREERAMGRPCSVRSFAVLDCDVTCVVYDVEPIALVAGGKVKQTRAALYAGARQCASSIVASEVMT